LRFQRSVPKQYYYSPLICDKRAKELKLTS
jgi:hypothetical protein